jgi:hypothetical protein
MALQNIDKTSRNDASIHPYPFKSGDGISTSIDNREPC